MFLCYSGITGLKSKPVATNLLLVLERISCHRKSDVTGIRLPGKSAS